MAMLAQRSVFGARAAPKAPMVAAARSRSAVKVQAFFGSKAAAPSGGAAAPAFMICIDCGYIYDGKDFKAEPGSYKCPVCSSPKTRFKVYKGGDVKGRPNNSQATMQKRKAEKKW